MVVGVHHTVRRFEVKLQYSILRSPMSFRAPCYKLIVSRLEYVQLKFYLRLDLIREPPLARFLTQHLHQP